VKKGKGKKAEWSPFPEAKGKNALARFLGKKEKQKRGDDRKGDKGEENSLCRGKRADFVNNAGGSREGAPKGRARGKDSLNNKKGKAQAHFSKGREGRKGKKNQKRHRAKNSLV